MTHQQGPPSPHPGRKGRRDGRGRGGERACQQSCVLCDFLLGRKSRLAPWFGRGCGAVVEGE